MSSPMDRLLSDNAARELEMTAVAALSMSPLTPPIVTTLASAVVALVMDRQARMEMATAGDR